MERTQPGVTLTEVSPGPRAVAGPFLRARHWLQTSSLFDWIIAIGVIGGLLGAVFADMPVKTSISAASDLKTVYASSWNFVHGANAYIFPNLQHVYVADGVILPPTWFGRAPVYPPTTLALLAPFTLLGMAPGIYLLTFVSGVLMALAIFCLLRVARERFGCGLLGRAVIGSLTAALPALGFALAVGNLSPAVAAMCMIAFLRRDHAPLWQTATLLAVALLLKPHLAFWMIAAMLVLPGSRSRRSAATALAGAAGFALVLTAVLAISGTLMLQMRGYAAILQAETSAGASMSDGSREMLPGLAQITSLSSILGFWLQSHREIEAIVAISLLAGLFVLVRRSRRVHDDAGALLAVSAWVSFSMLATYHRTHDAIMLLVLLPWLFIRLTRYWRDPAGWLIALLYAGTAFFPDYSWFAPIVEHAGPDSLTTFVLLRQSALASLCLMLVLLLTLWRESSRYTGREPAGV